MRAYGRGRQERKKHRVESKAEMVGNLLMADCKSAKENARRTSD